MSIERSGLREFQGSCAAAPGESAKMVREVENDAAELVVGNAGPRIPFRSGNARRSLRAVSGRITAGGPGAEYYPWLDFGGNTGPGRTGPRTGAVVRPFITSGRYLYPALVAESRDITGRMEEGVGDLLAAVGLEG